MSGGEADAIRITVDDLPLPQNNYISNASNPVYTTNTWDLTGTTTYPYTYYWSNTTTIYYYQITCPKRGCKTMNWAQLDTIVPCRSCGSKLKAVSQQADFEVPVK